MPLSAEIPAPVNTVTRRLLSVNKDFSFDDSRGEVVRRFFLHYGIQGLYRMLDTISPGDVYRNSSRFQTVLPGVLHNCSASRIDYWQVD